MKYFGKILEDAAREQGVSVAELARALGRNWSRVPQVFASKNLTERTFRDCARALGLELRVEFVGENSIRSTSPRAHFGRMLEDAAREQGVSVAELTRALGKAYSWVPQVFAGKNITEKSFRDCARALGLEPRIKLVPNREARRRIEVRKMVRRVRRPRRRNGAE